MSDLSNRKQKAMIVKIRRHLSGTTTRSKNKKRKAFAPAKFCRILEYLTKIKKSAEENVNIYWNIMEP